MIALEFEPAHGVAAPIDMLERYFGQHGWTSERSGDEEIVASVDGAWGQYELRALWREDDRVLQFVGLPGIKAAPEQHPAAYEMLGRINEQLWLGHFDMWAADGTILFRHAALLQDGDDEAGLSLTQAEALVEAALDECDRYYPAFDFVFAGGKSPEDALKAAMVDVAGEA